MSVYLVTSCHSGRRKCGKYLSSVHCIKKLLFYSVFGNLQQRFSTFQFLFLRKSFKFKFLWYLNYYKRQFIYLYLNEYLSYGIVAKIKHFNILYGS